MKFNNVRQFVVAALFAAASISQSAETTALWVFNGTDGAKLGDVVPNLVSGSKAEMHYAVVNENGTENTDIPKYSTSDVPAPYLFNDSMYTNLIASPTSVAVMQTGNTSAYDKTRRGAYLVATNVAEALGDGDWMVETFAKVDVLATDFRIIALRGCTNVVVNEVEEWSDPLSFCFSFLQNKSTGFAGMYKVWHGGDWGYFGRARQDKFPYEGFWAHYALRYCKEEDKFYSYCNGKRISAASSYGMWLNEKSTLEFFNLPHFASEVSVYAIRITKGMARQEGFFAYYNTIEPPDTVVHWRFEQTGDSDELTYVPNNGFETPFNGLVMESSLANAYTNDLDKLYVSYDGEKVRNRTAGSMNPADSTTGFGGYSFILEPQMGFKSMTVECLFKVYDDSPARQNIAGAYNATSYLDGHAWRIALYNGGSGNHLEVHAMTSTNDVYCQWYSGAYYGVTTNEWHHTAIVYDEDAQKIFYYYDYSLYKTVPYTKTGETRWTGFYDRGDYHLTVGRSSFTCNSFRGAVDEFRISRRALAPSEFIRQVDSPGTNLIFK